MSTVTDKKFKKKNTKEDLSHPKKIWHKRDHQTISPLAPLLHVQVARRTQQAMTQCVLFTHPAHLTTNEWQCHIPQKGDPQGPTSSASWDLKQTPWPLWVSKFSTCTMWLILANWQVTGEMQELKTQRPHTSDWIRAGSHYLITDLTFAFMLSLSLRVLLLHLVLSLPSGGLLCSWMTPIPSLQNTHRPLNIGRGILAIRHSNYLFLSHPEF